jgi:hypothetical protein
VNRAVEVIVHHCITPQRNNKGLASVRMDIGRGLAKEIYVVICAHGAIISNPE